MRPGVEIAIAERLAPFGAAGAYPTRAEVAAMIATAVAGAGFATGEEIDGIVAQALDARELPTRADVGTMISQALAAFTPPPPGPLQWQGVGYEGGLAQVSAMPTFGYARGLGRVWLRGAANVTAELSINPVLQLGADAQTTGLTGQRAVPVFTQGGTLLLKGQNVGSAFLLYPQAPIPAGTTLSLEGSSYTIAPN